MQRTELTVVSISNSESHLRSRMDKCALMMVGLPRGNDG